MRCAQVLHASTSIMALVLSTAFASAQQVIIDQLSFDGMTGLTSQEGLGSTSQNHLPRAADDVTLPPNTSGIWHITRLKATLLTNESIPQLLQGVFEIYADSGLGGPANSTPIARVNASGSTIIGTFASYNIVQITAGDGIGTILAAPAGTKLWVSALMSFPFTGFQIFDSSYFATHQSGPPLNGAEAYYRSDSTVNWAPASQCGCISPSDLAFKVEGTDGPAADACAAAYPIGDGTITFDTSGATTDGPATPGCGSGGTILNDIWFLYTAPAAVGACSGTHVGSVTVSTCGSAFDTAIAVYPGSCGDLSGGPIACNDDDASCGNGKQSTLTFQATAGVSYLIRVGSPAGQTGTGVLSVNSSPPNNTCSGAMNLPIAQVMPWCNLESVDETWISSYPCNPPFAYLPSHDLWYRFTPPKAGRVRFEVCPGSTTAVRIQVFSTCPSSSSQLGLSCGNSFYASSCGGVATEVFCATPGQSLLVRIGTSESGTGTGTVVAFMAADFNRNGATTVQDLFAFLAAWFAQLPSADFNHNSGVTVQDIFDFLKAWFGSC